MAWTYVRQLTCSPKLSPAIPGTARTISWSRNWPHCINMWVNTSSEVTSLVDMALVDTSRALGLENPSYFILRLHPKNPVKNR